MRSKALAVCVVTLALLEARVPALVQAREVVTSEAAAIRAEDLERRLRHLASEEMEGRETAEPGAALASAWIAEEMARLGLEPRGDDGSWFQGFTVPRPTLGEGNLLVVTSRDGERSFAVEETWNPFSASASAEAKAPLVFAGYGIRAPERSWDDYEGLDVRGRVVLVLRKDPGWNDVRHAAFRAKLSRAAEHGAAALLVVNDPATTKGGADDLAHWSAPIGVPAGSASIPFAFVSQEAARHMLAPLGADLDALEAALRAEGPGGVPAASRAVEGVRVRIRTALGRARQLPARNVVGFLPGTDPALAGEVVVVGAHYDHVGRGRFGSLGGASAAGQVHPGADDNASGASALLELAEHFAPPSLRPRRPLLFLAFAGEEMGLLGSAHYVAHPVLDLRQVVTMVNLDMVGRPVGGRLQIGGVGTGSGLQAICEQASEGHGLALSFDPQGEAPSDSTSFFRKGVPVLFFFTGLHEDYHRPSDVADRILWPEYERVVALAADVVRTLADRPERVPFTQPPPPQRPPFLGVRPSPEADPRGVLLEGVVEGGPAAQGGLRAGDVIVGLAGQIVRAPMDLMAALRRLEPGKTVEVVILRDGERRVIEVVLGRRSRR